MIGFPNAKINVGLRITAKRRDGYHDIETIFYPVMLCDALEFVSLENQNGKDYLTTTGISAGCDPDENIIIKTAARIHEKYSFPFLNIHLHKAIPTGAGLGGGSSDAICLLKGINKGFNLKIPFNELKSLSLELGSDCPFFLEGDPAYGSGRGEILTKTEHFLSGYYLVLINPGIEINTGEAYRNCVPRRPASSLPELIARQPTEWKGRIINDFEEYVFRMHPFIGKIKEELYGSGALFSLMSGSGSTVYGIFRAKPEITDQLKQHVIFEGFM